MEGRLLDHDTIFFDDEVLIREPETTKLVRVDDDDLLLEKVWTGKHRNVTGEGLKVIESGELGMSTMFLF